MIGSLLYLALRTRLDILPAVLILARFRAALTEYCFKGIKLVLRYLNGTRELCMRYEAGQLDISCFVDSDNAGDVVNGKSMSGIWLKIGNAVCAWASRKQPTVALPTCEAEYHALTLAAKEVLRISRVFKEAGFKWNGNPIIWSDNQSAISWAISEESPSARAKHIDVRVHFVRNLLKEENLMLKYAPSDRNDADVLTKPLENIKLERIRNRIGMSAIKEEF